jgi:hypothetical protein
MRFSHCLLPSNVGGIPGKIKKAWNQRYLGGFVSRKVGNIAVRISHSWGMRRRKHKVVTSCYRRGVEAVPEGDNFHELPTRVSGLGRQAGVSSKTRRSCSIVSVASPSIFR